MTGTDDQLLQSVADLYSSADPAPDDLADGVLARLAVDDLETEFELFTLVQAIDVGAGTRGGEQPDTSPTVALEFAGATYRVLVRISDSDAGVRRVDGWVVPALPLRVFLGPQGDDLAHTRQSAYADREGRFEFPDAVTGEVRLWLLPQPPRGSDDEASAPPFVTPPFLV
jgi:hypothetical protein